MQPFIVLNHAISY